MDNRPNPYPVRLSDEVMEGIKKSAKENERSINKEIEFGLKKYLQSHKEQGK